MEVLISTVPHLLGLCSLWELRTMMGPARTTPNSWYFYQKNL